MRADLSFFKGRDISKLRDFDALVASSRSGHPSRSGSEYLWHVESIYGYFRAYVKSRHPEQETFAVGEALSPLRCYLDRLDYVRLPDLYYWCVIDYYCGLSYHLDAMNWKYFRATIDTRGSKDWSYFMAEWERIVDPFNHRDYTRLDTRALALRTLYMDGLFFNTSAISQYAPGR